MNRALLLVSGNAGRGLFAKHGKDMLKRLHPLFSYLEVVESFDLLEAEKLVKDKSQEIDTLIVVGGDGSFYNVINWLSKEKKKPTLAYINGGTMGDVGKNFGISKNYKKAIRLIEQGKVTSFDVVKAGDKVFAYMAAVGAYSDVAYKTERRKKKAFGILSYYFKSIREAFHKQNVSVSVTTDDGIVETKVPFLLILNGANVGGFRINKEGSINDGKMEIYLPKPGLFNGLIPFFLSPKKVKRVSTSKAHIHVDGDLTWCFDGEEAIKGDIDVEILPSLFKIYSE